MIVEQVPFNSLSWSVGSLAVLLFGYRSWLSWRQTGSQLSKYFGWFGFVLGTSLGFAALPAYFSTDGATLRTYFVLGDSLLYAALLIQARIMWFIGLKHKIAFGWILAPALVASAVSWVAELLGTSVNYSSDFLHFQYPQLSSWIIAAMLVGIILPGGIFFIREGLRAGSVHVSSTFKAVSIGLAYLLIGGSSAYNYAFHRGADTLESTTVNLVLFVFMIAALLVPSVRSEGS